MEINSSLQENWLEFIDTLEKRFGTFEWFGHFTFREPLHPEQANKRWLRFIREINRKLYGKKHYKKGTEVFWVRATENQRRDAIHYHAFIGNGVRRLKRVDFMAIWEDIAEGYCRIWKYDGRINAKEYITKYIIKEGNIDIFYPKVCTSA